MTNTSGTESAQTIDDCRLIDIAELSKLTGLSKATLWRHHDVGLIPAGCKIGRAVRWRLRSGDPSTGILDWIEAGCPTLSDCSKNESGDHGGPAESD